MKRPCTSTNDDWQDITNSISLYASLHSSTLPPISVTPRSCSCLRIPDIVNLHAASALDIALPAPCDAEFNELPQPLPITR